MQKIYLEFLYQFLPSPQATHILLLKFKFTTLLASGGVLQYNEVLKFSCIFFQVFQVAYVIIKAANAPRPGNWILERSIDGTEFRPWQYYAISDTECLTRYNITPRIGPPTYKRDDEVICTSYYSRLVPLEHGEVTLFL